MCLSTVYTLRDSQRQELCKNVAAVTVRDGQLVFTDLMGRPTTVSGVIEKIDLMDNFILVKEA